MHGRMYSVQCSDKIYFLQLCIKCGVAKSSPGTHTALQAYMPQIFTALQSQVLNFINWGLLWKAIDEFHIKLMPALEITVENSMHHKML